MVVELANLPKKKIPFKFFDFWADHPLFLPLIFKTWCKKVMGTPIYVLCKKLKIVKGVLKEFNLKYFGKILERMLEAKQKMYEAQCRMQTHPSDLDIHKTESILAKEYVRLIEVEESFLRQKSRL